MISGKRSTREVDVLDLDGTLFAYYARLKKELGLKEPATPPKMCSPQVVDLLNAQDKNKTHIVFCSHRLPITIKTVVKRASKQHKLIHSDTFYTDEKAKQISRQNFNVADSLICSLKKNITELTHLEVKRISLPHDKKEVGETYKIVSRIEQKALEESKDSGLENYQFPTEDEMVAEFGEGIKNRFDKTTKNSQIIQLADAESQDTPDEIVVMRVLEDVDQVAANAAKISPSDIPYNVVVHIYLHDATEQTGFKHCGTIMGIKFSLPLRNTAGILQSLSGGSSSEVKMQEEPKKDKEAPLSAPMTTPKPASGVKRNLKEKDKNDSDQPPNKKLRS